jgi:hypothetical protein
MVWKKSKRSCKGSRTLKTVAEEAQPKLKSCLKKTFERLPLVHANSSQNESFRIRDEASRLAASTNGTRSVESRGSAESCSLQRQAHCTDQMSSTDESSTDNGHSQSQHSDQSAKSASQSGIKKKVRFNAIQIRDYERIVGDNPSCTTGPPLS